MGEPIRKIKDIVKTIQKAQMDICIRKLPHLKILYKLKNEKKRFLNQPILKKALTAKLYCWWKIILIFQSCEIKRLEMKAQWLIHRLSANTYWKIGWKNERADSDKSNNDWLWTCMSHSIKSFKKSLYIIPFIGMSVFISGDISLTSSPEL